MGTPAKGWNIKYQHVLMMTEKGLSNIAIAKSVGFSSCQISRIKNSEEFLKRQANFRRSVIERMQDVYNANAVKAVKTVCSLLTKGTNADKIRLEAAKDVLDRVGFQPIKVVETRTRSYTPQEVESARATVEEVEKVMDRLEHRTSKFVLPNRQRETSPDENQDVETPSDERAESSSDPRPETLSA